MPHVRVVKAFGPYTVGREIPEMPGLMADYLHRCGYVEYLDGRAETPAEQRAVRPRPESALLRRPRGRGRGSR